MVSLANDSLNRDNCSSSCSLDLRQRTRSDFSKTKFIFWRNIFNWNLSRTECLLLQVDLLEIALREQHDLVEKIFLVEATANHRGVHLKIIMSLSSSPLFNHHHHCIGGISQSSQSQSQSSPLSLSLPLPITESDRNYDFYSSIQSHWFGSGCNSLNGSVLKS